MPLFMFFHPNLLSQAAADWSMSSKLNHRLSCLGILLQTISNDLDDWKKKKNFKAKLMVHAVIDYLTSVQGWTI